MRKNIRQIFIIGAPLLAGQLSQYIMSIVDTAMVGRLNSHSLAAMAIGGLFTNIIFVLIWPLSVGTQAIASRKYGQEEIGKISPNETATVFNNSFFLAAIIGIIAFCLSFAAPLILSLLVKDESLLNLSLQYVEVFRWSYLPAALAMTINGFCSSIKKTQIVMITTIVSNTLNVLLNYIFIFGKFGFPAMRIRGAALGTVFSHFAVFLIFIGYIYWNKDFKRYKLFSFKNLDKSLQKRIIKIMIPPMVQNGIALSLFLVYESLVGSFGVIYLAVTHVTFSLFRINKTIVGGFSKGASILVGNSLGVKNQEKAGLLIKAMMVLAAGIGLIIMIGIYLFPGQIFSLFSKDPEALPVAIKALRFFCIFFFIEIVGFPLEIIFQQNGWGHYVLFSEFTSNIIFLLGFSWIFAVYFNGGIKAAWWGFALYQVLHSLILNTGWLSGRWKKALSKEL